VQEINDPWVLRTALHVFIDIALALGFKYCRTSDDSRRDTRNAAAGRRCGVQGEGIALEALIYQRLINQNMPITGSLAERLGGPIQPRSFERTPPEATPWQVRSFPTYQIREVWIRDNRERYDIERLSDDPDWPLRFRTLILRTPDVPPLNEVERIIMRYEFRPKTGDYLPPPLFD